MHHEAVRHRDVDRHARGLGLQVYAGGGGRYRIGQRHRHGHGPAGLVEGAVERLHGGDGGAAARGQHDDLVARAQRAAGETAGTK